MKITNTIFLSYLQCPYKARLLLDNQMACPTDYQILMADLAHRYKSSAQAALSRAAPDVIMSPDRAGVPSFLEDGPSLVFDTRIEIGDFDFHFDALKRSSATRSGAPQYEPVAFHHGATVSVLQQLLLTFGGYVLRLLQGHYPTSGIIVHGSQCSSQRVCLTPHYPKVELVVATLTKIANKEQQVPLLLNNNCGTCEFQSLCLAEAKQQDNLTLLNRMTEKAIKQYARKGIFTLNQLSHTFHPRRQSKRAKIQGRPHSFALQALAIRDQKVYILTPPALPPAETRIFIDMEGVPDGSFVYLIGLLVQQGDREQSFSFWADSQEQETKVFELFGQTLSRFPTGRIFHYGPYETRALKRIALRLGPASKWFIGGQSTNVLSELYAKVYFPTYSNRLKDVAGSLGYAWQAPTPSGLQALTWRHQWEQTHDPAVKATLLEYNLDDCRALKLLTNSLYDIGDQTSLISPPGSRPEVVPVESLVDQTERCNDAWVKRNSWSPTSNRSPSARISSTRGRRYICARTPVSRRSRSVRNEKRRNPPSVSTRSLRVGHERARFARVVMYVESKTASTLSCHSIFAFHMQASQGS